MDKVNSLTNGQFIGLVLVIVITVAFWSYYLFKDFIEWIASMGERRKQMYISDNDTELAKLQSTNNSSEEGNKWYTICQERNELIEDLEERVEKLEEEKNELIEKLWGKVEDNKEEG